MIAEPVLRSATPGDVPAIAKLLDAVFPANPKADPAVLRWQYWDNPFGPPSAWVWEADGVVVGHVTAFAVPLQLAGARAPGAKTADFAVAQPWRGRGLVPEALHAAADDLRARGTAAALCTAANPIAWHAMQRAGVRSLGLAEVWVLGAGGLGRALGPVARGGCSVEVKDSPPADLDALWAAVAPHEPYGIVHDAAWWAWRYAARPGGHYRYLVARRDDALAGAAAIVARRAKRVAQTFVLDFLAVDDDAARGLARAIRDDPQAGSVAVLATRGGTRLAGQAAASGFRRVPARLLPRAQHVGVLPLRDEDDLASAPWALRWGDYDHV